MTKTKSGERRHLRSSMNYLYSMWRGMVRRCTNPAAAHWVDYGGRGITICDRWLESFESFVDDMGQRPTKKHSLDRIDNDLGYSLENCRWATPQQQARNRRRPQARSGIIRIEGHSLREMAAIYGIPLNTLQWRYSCGVRGEDLTIRDRRRRPHSQIAGVDQ